MYKKFAKNNKNEMIEHVEQRYFQVIEHKVKKIQ